MSRELIYRFCSCGCGTGCDPHYGFVMEAEYCQEGARLGLRGEELGARLSAMSEEAGSRRSRRLKKALYLRMVRAIRDLGRHRGANASGDACRREAGELPPPGGYAGQEHAVS